MEVPEVAKGSTFPADDVPDRRALIHETLARHDPVPVPTTTLYLSIEDKRALADTFEAMCRSGDIEALHLAPGDPHFDAAFALTGLRGPAARAPLAVYRLVEKDRSERP